MGSQRVRHDLATKPPLPGLLYFFLSLEKLSAAHHHLLLSLHHIPGYTPTDLSLRRRSWMTHVYEMGALVMLVAQPCPNSCDLMDCRPPGSSVHGVLQAGILECAANPFSRGVFSWPRDQTQVSHIAGSFFTIWATREAQMGAFILFYIIFF